MLVHADHVCPLCHLGCESPDQFRAGRDGPAVETDWHPFGLRGQERRPDGTVDDSVETGKNEAYYERARQNVDRLAGEYGVEMDEPLLKDVDSYDARAVAWRARETHPELFEEFYRAVLDALWADGRDTGNPELLAGVAIEVGLPEGVVAETLADESSAEQLEAAFAASREQRISDVPTSETDEHTARGAVPPEYLRRLVVGASSERPVD